MADPQQNYRNVLSRLEAEGKKGMSAQDVYDAASFLPGTGEAIAAYELPGILSQGGQMMQSDDVLEALSSSFIICELHHNLINNGLAREQDLLKRASKYFETRLIKRETYNPNTFPELDHLGDLQRLIAVSESRTKNTRWLVCSPLQTVYDIPSNPPATIEWE